MRSRNALTVLGVALTLAGIIGGIAQGQHAIESGFFIIVARGDYLDYGAVLEAGPSGGTVFVGSVGVLPPPQAMQWRIMPSGVAAAPWTYYIASRPTLTTPTPMCLTASPESEIVSLTPWNQQLGQLWKLLCVEDGSFVLYNPHCQVCVHWSATGSLSLVPHSGNIDNPATHWKLVLVDRDTASVPSPDVWRPESATHDWSWPQPIGAVGLAAADIDKNGMLDMVVGWEDESIERAGMAALYYRIGWNVGNGGVPMCWTSRMRLAELDWPWKGAARGGIEVVDIDGDEAYEIVAFAINAETNKSVIAVSGDLGIDGRTTACTCTYEYHGWRPGRSPARIHLQGSGIGSGDLDNNGRPELVLFFAHDVNPATVGDYVVLWNVTESSLAAPENQWTNTNVPGPGQQWTGPFTVLASGGPYNVSGAGVDICEMAVGPLVETKIVVYYIENTSALDQAFYCTGNLDSSGAVTLWSPWHSVAPSASDWSLWSDGGGIAVANVDEDGEPELFYAQSATLVSISNMVVDGYTTQVYYGVLWGFPP